MAAQNLLYTETITFVSVAIFNMNWIQEGHEMVVCVFQHEPGLASLSPVSSSTSFRKESFWISGTTNSVKALKDMIRIKQHEEVLIDIWE